MENNNMKWVVKTNFGYVAGSSGRSNMKVTYTDNKANATYSSLTDARIWAGEIMEYADNPVLSVSLETVEE